MISARISGLLLTAVSALLGGATLAHAQSSAFFTNYSTPSWVCDGGQESSYAPGGGLASVSCTTNPLGNFVGQAATPSGSSRAYTSGSSAGMFESGTNINARIDARTYWQDVLRFTGTVPATVVFQAYVSGTLEFSTSGVSSNATATETFTLQAQSLHPGAPLRGVSNSYAGNGGSGNGTPTYGLQVIRDVLTLEVQVAPSSAGISFVSQLLAGTYVFAQYGTGFATSDFSRGTGISSVAFYDANGDDISNSVTYAFDAGTEFVPLETATPEPASIVLVASGMIAALCITRRRRVPAA